MCHISAHKIPARNMFDPRILLCRNLNWSHGVFSVFSALSELVVKVKAPAIDSLLRQRVFGVCFHNDKGMSSSSCNVFYYQLLASKPLDLCHGAQIVNVTCAKSSKVSFSTGVDFSISIKSDGEPITSAYLHSWTGDGKSGYNYIWNLTCLSVESVIEMFRTVP